MRRRVLLVVGLLVASGLVLWLAAPRLLDQFAPAWTVTAAFPAAASDSTVEAAQECLDVIASSRVSSDLEAGMIEADFHAMQWEVRRASDCLGRVAGVTEVVVTQR